MNLNKTAPLKNLRRPQGTKIPGIVAPHRSDRPMLENPRRYRSGTKELQPGGAALRDAERR